MNAPLRLSLTDGDVAQLTVRLVEGQSAAVAVQATNPLKLLVPTPRGGCVWAYATTYGGGLLAGDRVHLRVAVEAGARLYLGTQASTKIYRSDDGRGAEQHLSAAVGPGATLVALPDPVTPFAGARFSQRQEIALDGTAGLVWLDGLTAGRAAREERWQFTDYRSRLTVSLDGVPLLTDAVHLCAGLRSVAERCGGAGAFATLVVGGPPVGSLIASLHAAVDAQPLDQRPLMALSPLKTWGVLIRLAAGERESLERTLRTLLGDVRKIIGDDPWQRRP